MEQHDQGLSMEQSVSCLLMEQPDLSFLMERPYLGLQIKQPDPGLLMLNPDLEPHHLLFYQHLLKVYCIETNIIFRHWNYLGVLILWFIDNIQYAALENDN